MDRLLITPPAPPERPKVTNPYLKAKPTAPVRVPLNPPAPGPITAESLWPIDATTPTKTPGLTRTKISQKRRKQYA